MHDEFKLHMEFRFIAGAAGLWLSNFRITASDPEVAQPELHMYFEFIMYSMVTIRHYATRTSANTATEEAA